MPRIGPGQDADGGDDGDSGMSPREARWRDRMADDSDDTDTSSGGGSDSADTGSMKDPMASDPFAPSDERDSGSGGGDSDSGSNDDSGGPDPEQSRPSNSNQGEDVTPDNDDSGGSSPVRRSRGGGSSGTRGGTIDDESNSGGSSSGPVLDPSQTGDVQTSDDQYGDQPEPDDSNGGGRFSDDTTGGRDSTGDAGSSNDSDTSDSSGSGGRFAGDPTGGRDSTGDAGSSNDKTSSSGSGGSTSSKNQSSDNTTSSDGPTLDPTQTGDMQQSSGAEVTGEGFVIDGQVVKDEQEAEQMAEERFTDEYGQFSKGMVDAEISDSGDVTYTVTEAGAQNLNDTYGLTPGETIGSGEIPTTREAAQELEGRIIDETAAEYPTDVRIDEETLTGEFTSGGTEKVVAEELGVSQSDIEVRDGKVVPTTSEGEAAIRNETSQEELDPTQTGDMQSGDDVQVSTSTKQTQRNQEQFGDIDWSFGMGDPKKDEVENALESGSRFMQKKGKQFASGIFDEGGVGSKSAGAVVLRKAGYEGKAEAYETNLRKFGKGVAQAPFMIGDVSGLGKTALEGVETTQFAVQNPGERGDLADAGVSAAKAAGSQAKKNPASTAGLLVGSLGASYSFMRLGSKIGPRTGTATRYAIQPGEEAAGSLGYRATKAATSTKRADQLFPNKEPLVFSEEAAIRGAKAAKKKVSPKAKAAATRAKRDLGTFAKAERGQMQMGKLESRSKSSKQTITADDLADKNFAEPEGFEPMSADPRRPEIARKPEKAGINEQGSFVGSYTRSQDPAFGGTGKPNSRTEGETYTPEMMERMRDPPWLSSESKASVKQSKATRPQARVDDAAPSRLRRSPLDTELESRSRLSRSKTGLESDLRTELEGRSEVRSEARRRFETTSATSALRGTDSMLRSDAMQSPMETPRSDLRSNQEPSLDSPIDTRFDVRAGQETKLTSPLEARAETRVRAETGLETELESRMESELENELELELEAETRREVEPFGFETDTEPTGFGGFGSSESSRLLDRDLRNPLGE